MRNEGREYLNTFYVTCFRSFITFWNLTYLQNMSNSHYQLRLVRFLVNADNQPRLVLN